jgi:alcohol dehydrogenase class IV
MTSPTDQSEPRKFVAPEIIFGDHTLELVARYAANFGASRVLLVTDPGVAAAGWTAVAEQALRSASVPTVVFDGVTPNPKDHEVMAGAEVYRHEQCNMIVAVGGGSPMDCAKGIGIVATNGRHILAYEGIDEVDRPCPPLICIPTTAGSSADVSQFAVITDSTRGVKVAIISKTIVPDVALIDPVTTTTMPADLTAATGLDALAHAFEAYVSTASSPLTDVNALGAVPRIVRHLPEAVRHPEGLEHRREMMMASLMAGLAFSNASLGAMHAMAHALGGLLSMPHGAANAILLPHVTEFNFPAAADRYLRLGEALGLDLAGLPACDVQRQVVARLTQLAEEASYRPQLKEYGLRREDIPRLAANAMADPCLVTNPRPVTIQDLEDLYARALFG